MRRFTATFLVLVLTVLAAPMQATAAVWLVPKKGFHYLVSATRGGAKVYRTPDSNTKPMTVRYYRPAKHR